MSYQNQLEVEVGGGELHSPPAESAVSESSSGEMPRSKKPLPSQAPGVLDTYFADNRVEVPPGEEVSGGVARRGQWRCRP